MTKRVNIFDKKENKVMRVSRLKASIMIATDIGRYSYTTKSKLKSFLNRNFKITRNMRVLEKLNFGEGSSNKVYQDEKTGKAVATYVNTSHTTFKGRSYSYQHRVVKFPD